MIPTYLLDTNILVRIAEAGTDESAIATAAVGYLLGNSVDCFITAQILIEFWAVATRPRVANGLGWELNQAVEEVVRIASPDISQIDGKGPRLLA